MTVAPVRFAMIVVAQIAFVITLLTGLLYVFQDRFIYPGASAGRPSRMPTGFTSAMTDAGAIHFRPGRNGLPVILMMHGNGGGIADADLATRVFATSGCGIAVVGYPGYDGTPGRPSEQSLNAASTAAYRWLLSRGTPAGRIVVLGNSIGSGPAVRLASERRVGGLVLVSRMANLPDIAVASVPFVPRSLIRDHYDNETAIRSVRAPVLLVHAMDDQVVPAGDMDVLAAAAGARASRIALPTGGHQIMFDPRVQRMIEDWMRGRAGPHS